MKKIIFLKISELSDFRLDGARRRLPKLELTLPDRHSFELSTTPFASKEIPLWGKYSRSGCFARAVMALGLAMETLVRWFAKTFAERLSHCVFQAVDSSFASKDFGHSEAPFHPGLSQRTVAVTPVATHCSPKSSTTLNGSRLKSLKALKLLIRVFKLPEMLRKDTLSIE